MTPCGPGKPTSSTSPCPALAVPVPTAPFRALAAMSKPCVVLRPSRGYADWTSHATRRLLHGCGQWRWGGLCRPVCLALPAAHRSGAVASTLRRPKICCRISASTSWTRRCTGVILPPMGNHHPAMAPHNCYPCQGEDRWLVMRGHRRRMAALCQRLGTPWAMQEKFATLAGRLQHQDELDQHLAAWTSTRSPHRHGASAGAWCCRRHGVFRA